MPRTSLASSEKVKSKPASKRCTANLDGWVGRVAESGEAYREQIDSQNRALTRKHAFMAEPITELAET